MSAVEIDAEIRIAQEDLLEPRVPVHLDGVRVGDGRLGIRVLFRVVDRDAAQRAGALEMDERGSVGRSLAGGGEQDRAAVRSRPLVLPAQRHVRAYDQVPGDEVPSRRQMDDAAAVSSRPRRLRHWIAAVASVTPSAKAARSPASSVAADMRNRAKTTGSRGGIRHVAVVSGLSPSPRPCAASDDAGGTGEFRPPVPGFFGPAGQLVLRSRDHGRQVTPKKEARRRRGIRTAAGTFAGPCRPPCCLTSRATRGS